MGLATIWKGCHPHLQNITPPSPTTPPMFCQTSQPPPFNPLTPPHQNGGGGHYEYRQHKGTSHSLCTEACHLHKLEILGGPRLTLEGHHILKYPEWKAPLIKDSDRIQPVPTKSSDWSDTAAFGRSPLWERGDYQKKKLKKLKNIFFEKSKILLKSDQIRLVGFNRIWSESFMGGDLVE